MDGIVWAWILFNVFVLGMLALDLGVFHRKAHDVGAKEAITWSLVWVALAGVFNVILWLYWGQISPASTYSNNEAALAFLTGYLIEKSLAIDNIFVFVLLFAAFKVPSQLQHRVLFWGVLGALVMRGVMIALGAALIAEFHWILYLFAAFLIFAGIKMFVHTESEEHPESGRLSKWIRRMVPMTENYEGSHFFVKRAGKWLATPLFLVLVLVEISDLVFAVDSIPAIFAVTLDPFIVYTSNVFAILGLRSMYFLLAGMIHRFVYLKPALAAVLVFVGIKMLLAETAWKIATPVSLGVVATILVGGIGLSLWKTRQEERAAG